MAFRSALVFALTAGLLGAQSLDDMRQSMNRPFEPYHAIGNIYYVGPAGLSSFLITTSDGHFLIDSGFEETAPMIEASIKKLGFRIADVKILLSSHAHIDHVAGHAAVKRLSGAQIVVMEGDVHSVENGVMEGDFDFEEDPTWEPVKVDRVLEHGDTVTLGGVTLTAHRTPGHTRGCTTWTMKTEHEGRRLDVVFVGGTSIPSNYRLTQKPTYAGIVEDYAEAFEVLSKLPADVYFGQHAFMFRMEEKYKKLQAGAATNPFVDPEGYRQFIERETQRYRARLAKEGGE